MPASKRPSTSYCPLSAGPAARSLAAPLVLKPIPSLQRNEAEETRTESSLAEPTLDRFGTVGNSLALTPNSVTQLILKRRLRADAVVAVVVLRKSIEEASQPLVLPETDLPTARQELTHLLKKLNLFNFARFGLSEAQVRLWIEAGRPCADWNGMVSKALP